MTSPPSTDKRIKLIVTGPVGVGKTSVLEYFVLNKFQRFMDSTIGATFHTKDMYIDEQKVSYEIWDTAGQERYRSLLPLYYRQSHAVLLVYDYSAPDGIERLISEKWLEEVYRHHQGEVPPIVYLVSNKIDLVPDQSSVKDILDQKHQKLTTYASEKGLDFYQVSAKTGENIISMFHGLAKKCVDEGQYKTSIATNSNTFNIKRNSISSKCCVMS